MPPKKGSKRTARTADTALKSSVDNSEPTSKDSIDESSLKGENGKGIEPVKTKAAKKDVKKTEEPSPAIDDDNTSSSEVSEQPASKKRGRPTKGNKPAEKKSALKNLKDVDKDEEMDEGKSNSSSESADEPLPKKRGKAAKGKEEDINTSKDHAISDDEESDVEPVPVKSTESRPSKRAATKGSSDELGAKKSKTATAKGDSKPMLNKTSSDYGDIKFDSAAQNKDGKPWNFKISSWNVAGLKAWVKKDGVDFIKHEKPDIICLQETKCLESNLPPEAKVPGYHTYWLSGEKGGYAGVALLSKEKPIKVDYGIGDKEFDCDGRLITAEYDKFFLVAVYVPNAGQKLKNLDRRMKWDPVFRTYLKKLDEKKPVILCGDLNVSHTEIDLANPKTNTRSAGFTQEERDGFSDLLKEGFVDTFRHLYPDQKGAYTFWTYMGNARSRNTGWRLDYFVLSERLVPSVCDNVIRNTVYGSDHCPITLFLHV